MIGAYWIVLEEEYRVFSPAGELCTILAPVKLQALKQVPLVLRPDRVKLRPEQVVSSRVSAWDWLGQVSDLSEDRLVGQPLSLASKLICDEIGQLPVLQVQEPPWIDSTGYCLESMRRQKVSEIGVDTVQQIVPLEL